MLMALQQTGRLEPVQSLITRLTTPAQLGTTGLTESITGFVRSIVVLRTLQQRVAELEQQNDSLLVENFRLRDIERENTELRELLNFAQARPGLDLRGGQIVARVIGQNSTNFQNSITIDLGMQHGMTAGMPVTTDQGLVGRITEVTNDTSKVLLITDPRSSVNAVIQNTRDPGLVVGSPGGRLVMDFIPQAAKFGLGEVIVTAGSASELGARRFPKGIPIGQVEEIIRRDVETSQQAIVRPLVDIAGVELVLVVTNFDPLEQVPLLEVVPEEGGVRILESQPAESEPPVNDGIDPTPADETSTEDSVP